MLRSVLIIVLVSFKAVMAEDANWPSFRGKNASGISETATPPREFGPNKNLKWKVALPSGISCPSVWGDNIFLTAYADNKLWTLCYSLKDGKELWKQEAPATEIEAFHHSEGSPAASTVATDGEHVVSYFGSCGVICYSTYGKELWQYKLPVAETNNRFGTGVSPIIAGDKVILQRDLSKDSKLIALNINDGKPVWITDRTGTPTSFSTPALWNQEGQEPQLIITGSLMIKGYSLQDGKEIWSVAKLPAVTCTTPVFADGLLIYAGWSPGEDFQMPPFAEILKQGDKDGNGKLSKQESETTFIAKFFDNNDTDHDGEIEPEEWQGMLDFLRQTTNRMIAIKPGAKGDATSTHVVWERKKGLPYVSSALAYKGRAYIIKDGGILSCYNTQTGKPYFEMKRLEATGGYYASPVAAADRVYFASLDGIITTIKASDKLEVISSIDLGERAASTPALVGNTFLIRTEKHLWAFSEK